MNNNLKEKITAWEPAAVWSESGDGWFTVPADRFRDLAVRLRAEGFDFLRSLTGMDWGEEGFGVVYHLESTATGENVVLRTVTPDRENPVLASVCDLWKTAELNEREAFDYFGIRFLNHPDMRRLFLRDDWVGYPLRKDYDPSQNPLRMSNEVARDSTASFELMPDGSIIRQRNVLFDEEEYVINIGPQHPATHGVLRFRVSLEGEIIRKLDAHCGYIHRGIEKMCEELTYPQTLALTDRLDYLGAAQNRHALCMCIEKGLGVEVPERVQYIPHDHGRAAAHRFAPALLLVPLHGHGGPDGLLLRFPRPREGARHPGADHRRPSDTDLQHDRRRAGRHPSRFRAQDQGVYRLHASDAARVPRGLHRQRHRTGASEGYRRADARRCHFVRRHGRYGTCFGVGPATCASAIPMPPTARSISRRYSSRRATVSPAIWSGCGRSSRA